jgi:hypothetical protein
LQLLPYNAKLCLNGHEYAKRELAQKGIAFRALDNGILTCADPKRLQTICDGLSAAKVDALLRKWLRLLPHPFTGADRKAGYRYAISILLAEFSLTQVLDRPVHGRLFFEQAIGENLDLGRPEEVQLIFNRRIPRHARARFRTRVVTHDVTPSLNIYYKNTRIKQYHKENRALRTETTINNTYDFGVSKRLHNLPKLRAIGFAANRRLLEIERISHDCILSEDVAGHRLSGDRRPPAHVRSALCRPARSSTPPRPHFVPTNPAREGARRRKFFDGSYRLLAWPRDPSFGHYPLGRKPILRPILVPEQDSEGHLQPKQVRKVSAIEMLFFVMPAGDEHLVVG